MRRDPKDYDSVRLIHKLNKDDYDRQKRLEKPFTLLYKKKDDKFVRDVLAEDDE